MTQYDDKNKGGIWKNDKKESDTHPDFRGQLNVDGVEYWVSAWKRAPDANPKAPALKFSIQKKEDVHNKGVQQATQAVDTTFDDDSSIPF